VFNYLHCCSELNEVPRKLIMSLKVMLQKRVERSGQGLTADSVSAFAFDKKILLR
jgi:hypothetical protein